MKKLIFLNTILLLFVFSSCLKRKNMEVVRDCTGTYLRLDGKDYQVCNFDRVASYENGVKVRATFKKIKSCPSSDHLFICQMAHKSEGWIEVEKISAE